MFRGIRAIAIDTKGRLALPSRYRDPLQTSSKGQLIATIDTEDLCLLLYPQPEWEIIEEKLQRLPTFNKAARRIQRLLIGHATEVEMDANARILLPQELRDYAKIDKHVMLVGQGKKFEIWDEAVWSHQREVWLSEETDRAGALPEEILSLSL